MMRWLALAMLAAAPAAALQKLPLEQNETIRKTFPVTGGSNAKKLLVDNINGFIHVTGYGGTDVQLTAQKRIRAESAESMQDAAREVKLDLSQQGNFVRAYVDGPFRSHDGVNYRGPKFYGYDVAFDFDIQVPYGTELLLKTVNGGDVKVEKTSAVFDIANVNGGIEMREISGSGNVHTVNGPVKVQFSRNPTEACSFKTINGPVDIYFQRGLSADLQFKTFNGGVYTDFNVAALPTPAGTAERKDGKFIYRGNRFSNGRVGRGGPELKFDTLNGSIRLHEGA